MESLVVWSCLVVLLQFHGILSEEPPLARREGSDERIKRHHESDHEKLRARHELYESPRTNIPQKPKISTKVVIKHKLPINERNQPKNVKVINHILEEIASVAHNHNQSKGIHKIKHLIDELDKQNDIKAESKVENENLAEIDKFVKTLKKEESNEETEIAKEVPTNRMANETKTQVELENNDPLERFAKPLKKSSTGPLKKIPNVKEEEKMETPEVKPTQSNRICNAEEKTPYERTGEKYNDDNSWNSDLKNENRIEIAEHTYEEESLHTLCKYTQPDSYNWYYSQDYDRESYANYYTNYGNYFYSNGYTVEPQTTSPCNYEEYNRNYYTNDYDYNKDLDELVTNKINDCVRQRKSWLDKNTVIDVKDPSEYQVKNINENKQQITSVYGPDFQRKYYSVTQKQAKYSSDDKNVYYKDPYHCS